MLNGMFNTLVTFVDVDGSMMSPSSLRISRVLTFLSLSAKQLCFWYRKYLGLIGRDELFSINPVTVIPSPVEEKKKKSYALNTTKVSQTYFLNW